ncbi:4Fe-4S dicluster domain-containing protein [Clostridium ganghwense]|uniref:4Fe-4S dicluster domain-containing protein n=1 Tax=Clostridium ganghwense TaxID=312089 RepID=A0ABT4CLE8_9CLOT|nr:4Fe-4S dicluster domain-containing protein [Clostridium ganghwense]MCY6369753.1 4Fe-4S dicluster domain-containing protein [Clostridium ganghwense]
MNVFETQLKKLKYEVLREVALLAKEDRLTEENIDKIPYKIIPGNKPTYRCCVYHERAILKERAKIASGYITNGDCADYIMDKDKDDQIMYVIEAACDTCPINKYTITEVCRGCIQHKCMEVCPANAITRINGKAYINQNLCRECGLCKKACPYNAVSEVMRPCKKVCPTDALDIDYEDRRAIIKEEDCINCGACMAACPFGAISDKSYIVSVINNLKSDKKVYAVIAPSITGQFGPSITVGQVKDALEKLGFENMVEAAYGADAVTLHEAMEFVERMEKGEKYMTNSCCPGFVAYIENKFKDQVENISNTVSPMIATAKLIKKNDEDAVIVFIGPCTAKKMEMKKEEVKGLVDYVLTFEELAAIISAYKIDLESCNDVEVDDASAYGRGFAQGGGLTAAIKNIIKDKEIDIEFKPVTISGRENIKRYMLLAKNGKLPGNFIEGMMCDGGCIGGAATVCSQNKAKMPLNKFSKGSKNQNIIENEKLEEFKDINLDK